MYSLYIHITIHVYTFFNQPDDEDKVKSYLHRIQVFILRTQPQMIKMKSSFNIMKDYLPQYVYFKFVLELSRRTTVEIIP